MGSSGRSGIPQQGNPTEARAFRESFFLSTDGSRQQMPRVSQETGESPLGSVPERSPWPPTAERPSGSSSGGHSPHSPQVALQDHSPEPSSAQGSPRALPWREEAKRLKLKLEAWPSSNAPMPSRAFQAVDSKASSLSLPHDVRSGKVLRARLLESTQASTQGSEPTVLPSVLLQKPDPRDIHRHSLQGGKPL